VVGYYAVSDAMELIRVDDVVAKYPRAPWDSRSAIAIREDSLRSISEQLSEAQVRMIAHLAPEFSNNYALIEEALPPSRGSRFLSDLRRMATEDIDYLVRFKRETPAGTVGN
jgi:hypothetical protein